MRSSWFTIVGLCAAAAIAAGCATDVGAFGPDSGTNNLINDAAVIETSVSPMDAGRACTNVCRPGFLNNAECICTSQCMPACSEGETCQVSARTGIWDCVSSDAGVLPTVDVQSPPVDNGPDCVSDRDCTATCPDPSAQMGRTTCSPQLGCLCVQRPAPDAGTPATDVVVPMVDVPMGCAISGQTNCNGACVDLQSNNANCGICGNICGAGNRCQTARCVLDCAAGLTECSGTCVNLVTSEMHCGRCGNACPVRANALVTCASNACGFTCANGFADVNRDAADGCEVNLNTSLTNCGTPGTICPTSVTNGRSQCLSGRCVVACTAGFIDLDGLSANGCEINTTTDRNNCGARGNNCAAGTTCCGGACVDLQSNSANCGGCGTACTGSSVCVLGRCTGLCPVSWPMCGGACVDQSSSTEHCGRCGNSCPSAANSYAACQSGACAMGRCYGGFGNCNGNSADGCEVNTTNDPRNCGACGNACPSGPNSAATCGFYGCGLVCTAGFRSCDANPANGCETNVNTDRNNCGGCGWACQSGERCDGGWCVLDCATPRTACGDRCIDTRTDVNNCGGCGSRFTCATGVNMTTTCRASTCTYACAAGTTDCDGNLWNGCEVSTTTTTNCGACGNRCGSGQACVAGSCACPSGSALCGGACVNTQTDATNCGGCGRSCPSGQTCSAGVCFGTTPVDAGTPDTGVDAGTGPVDSGTDVIVVSDGMAVCPTGTIPRRIEYQVPPSANTACGGPGSARSIAWGIVHPENVRFAAGTIVEPITQPFPSPPVPLYHSPGGAALVLTDTFPWEDGVPIDLSGRCLSGTYLEGLRYWDGLNFVAAGGRFIENGRDRSSEVFRDGNKFSVILGPRCIPAP